MANTEPTTAGSAAVTQAITWTEGSFLHFALYEAKGGVTTRAQVSFRVDDLDRAHDAATAAGADVLHEPRSEPWGRSARYRDPDGSVVEPTEPG
ncbi:MAG: VOC family protein [Acidimicrobiales bacterium]|nr:VOC family protein [Acidimicrobiales bacterium]